MSPITHNTHAQSLLHSLNMSSIEKLEVTVVSAALKEDPSGMLVDSANYVHIRFGATK